MRSLLLLTPLLLPFALPGPGHADSVQLRDADRVLLLANTLVERAQVYGHWETALQLAAGDKALVVRNLGWSGDTVEGRARSYFGPPKEGFQRLESDVQDFQPTVILLGYGAVAAHSSPANIPDFLDGYRRLLSMLVSEANPREVILLSPPPAETLPAPLPDQSAYNQRLARYGSAIQRLAEEQGHRFVDLYQPVLALESSPEKFLTDNGIHYSDEGYRRLATVLLQGLGLEAPAIRSRHEERLRELIVAKNRLFFHHWRPANETYLRGFRQHEQGQNAAELELFEPLIRARELEIGVMKRFALSQLSKTP